MTLVRRHRHRVLHRFASLFEAINARCESAARRDGRKSGNLHKDTRISGVASSLPHSAAKKTANAALHFSSGDNGGEW